MANRLLKNVCKKVRFWRMTVETEGIDLKDIYEAELRGLDSQ